MTNEDIRQFAGEITDNAEINWAMDVIRKAIMQAYEEAAGAMCEGCRNGWSYNWVSMRHTWEGGTPECQAWRIRRLIDSLTGVAQPSEHTIKV